MWFLRILNVIPKTFPKNRIWHFHNFSSINGSHVHISFSWHFYTYHFLVAVAIPWPLAMLAKCVARSLTYSWVYGTINPLRDSLITEVIKHLNVQTRWASDDVYAFATRRGRQPGRLAAWHGKGRQSGAGEANQAVTN